MLMPKRFLIFCLILTGSLFLAVAAPVLAVQTPAPAAGGGINTYGMEDPVGGLKVPQLVARILNWVLPLTGSLLLLMFIWGGLQWFLAGGDKSKVEKATTTLTNAAIGMAIIIGAYIIVDNLVGKFGAAIEGGTANPSGAPQAQAPQQ